MNGVEMVYIVSEEDRGKLSALKPQDVRFVSSIEEVTGENIVYLADRQRLVEVKRRDIKLVERGNAGPVIELSLCLYLLEENNYRPFLDKLMRLGLIDRVEMEPGEIIELPRIRKCLQMWDELQKDISYLDVWA